MVILKKSTKRIIEESIMTAIYTLSENIQITLDDVENKNRAEAIKTLAEAYDTVHRGKKAHEF